MIRAAAVDYLDDQFTIDLIVLRQLLGSGDIIGGVNVHTVAVGTANCKIIIDLFRCSAAVGYCGWGWKAAFIGYSSAQ